jgi:hypothetical protein
VPLEPVLSSKTTLRWRRSRRMAICRHDFMSRFLRWSRNSWSWLKKDSWGQQFATLRSRTTVTDVNTQQIRRNPFRDRAAHPVLSAHRHRGRDPGQPPGRTERRLRREPAALHPPPQTPKMLATAGINKPATESDITQHPPREAAQEPAKPRVSVDLTPTASPRGRGHLPPTQRRS